MAITQAYTGIGSISTTEYSLVNNSTTLASSTNVGVYQVFIDTTILAGGDQYEIKIKEKISAGTQIAIYIATLDGKQGTPFVTPTLVLMEGWDVTMKKLAGSDRTFAWSIRKVG